MCIRKHVKISQQLKLPHFLKRKGDNNDAVTGASKQSNSSSINDVEIVHAIQKRPLALQWKKNVKTDSGFMAFGFCLARV